MEALIKIGVRSIAYLWELLTNQKNKKLKEIQLQRDQNKAFIAYEKISKTIESVIHEQQIEDCFTMINNCCNLLNIDLFLKLHRELELKQKSLNQSFNS